MIMNPAGHSLGNEIQSAVASNQDIVIQIKKKGTVGYGFDSSPELPDSDKLIDLHPTYQ